jgi:hypothetical protein
MTEQSQTPLIGPLKQRGWREIARFRPISKTLHAALVVIRQGRLVGVIPANDRRVLSDYVTWPYDFHEVDMRERLLLISRRVESCDAEYVFDATLKLIYQVERPERVALELEDALAELEDVLAQSMRVTSRAFGVEQAKALEENLREALLYGDVLQGRFAALGLALRRADVVVDLDERARARAEMLRAHMREHPLMVRQAIESLDPTSSFDVLVGGSYRLTSRVPAPASLEDRQSALQEMIIRTLARVGITFAPQDYQDAAQAMAEALRHDSLLLAELAAADLDLVRPTVKIQPDRQMVVVAQSAQPASSAPEGPVGVRRVPALLPDFANSAEESENASPWAGLGAAFGREAQPFLKVSDEPAPAQDAPRAATHAPNQDAARDASDDRPRPLAPPADQADAAPNSAPGETGGAERSPGEPVFFAPPEDQPPASASQPATPPASPEPQAAHPEDIEIDAEQVERWLALLKADNLAMYKLRILEITAQPDTLPLILTALTNEPAVLSRADDPRYQQALLRALAEPGGYQPQAAAEDAPASVDLPAPQPAEPAEVADPPPDWLRLRRGWRSEGDAE